MNDCSPFVEHNRERIFKKNISIYVYRFLLYNTYSEALILTQGSLKIGHYAISFNMNSISLHYVLKQRQLEFHYVKWKWNSDNFEQFWPVHCIPTMVINITTYLEYMIYLYLICCILILKSIGLVEIKIFNCLQEDA